MFWCNLYYLLTEGYVVVDAMFLYLGFAEIQVVGYVLNYSVCGVDVFFFFWKGACAVDMVSLHMGFGKILRVYRYATVLKWGFPLLF